MPYGVAAPPTPKRFADKFMHTASAVSSFSTAKSFLTSGLRRFASIFVKPQSCQISIMPDQRAYEASKERQSALAAVPPERRVGKTDSGARKSRSKTDRIQTQENTAFMVLFYEKKREKRPKEGENDGKVCARVEKVGENHLLF